MAKGRKTGQTIAAEAALRIRQAFERGKPPAAPEVTSAVGSIAEHGTIEEALLTLMALPAEDSYGLARMALLERVLRASKQQLVQPWYQQRLPKLVLLPAEYQAFEQYCAKNNIELTGKRKVIA
jgi:hypothetical protein